MKRVVTIALFFCLYTFSYAQKTCRIYMGWNDGVNGWPMLILPLDSIKEEMKFDTKSLSFKIWKSNEFGSYEQPWQMNGLKYFRITFSMDYNVLDYMSVINTTYNSVTLKCNVVNTKSLLNVGFECAENVGAPLYLDLDNLKTISSTSNGEFTSTFNDLKSCTSYCFRPYAIVDGKKYYGSTSYVTTKVPVSFQGILELNANSVTLMTTVDDLITTGTLGIMYGTDSSLDTGNEIKKELTSVGYRSIKLSDLLPNTTYYYRAYALINGKYYYGNQYTFKTIKDFYEVGDVYPNTGTPEGIVFYVSSNGKQGKIFSIEQARGTWSEMRTWAKNLGTGWYMPSKNELSTIASQSSKYSYLFEGFYWSSTMQSSGIYDNYYLVCIGDWIQYYNGQVIYNTETERNKCVAVKSF